jgi:hypothetical protein
MRHAISAVLALSTDGRRDQEPPWQAFPGSRRSGRLSAMPTRTIRCPICGGKTTVRYAHSSVPGHAAHLTPNPPHDEGAVCENGWHESRRDEFIPLMETLIADWH